MIHATAIIEPGAKLGKNVQVGAFTYIGNDVELGDDCIVESHVVIKGPSYIGKGNRFFQFSSIGEECQDKKYAGEPTELYIGDNNVFRESVSVHRGTIQDDSKTIIGSNNLFMANAHVAHDCIIGDNNIFANTVTLAGHVHLGDWCILGGFVGVHQFCEVGSHSFCGAGSIVVQDVPPFVMVAMSDNGKAAPFGINKEGLKRRGYSSAAIRAVFRAYKSIYRESLTLDEAQEKIKSQVEEFPELQLYLDFFEKSTRGIVR